MTSDLRFVWHEQKAISNLKKHGVSFNDAAQVFRDPNHLMRQDRVDEGEIRWQTIGAVNGFTLVLVAHTYCEDFDDGTAEFIRIIPARRATKSERRIYEENRSTGWI